MVIKPLLLLCENTFRKEFTRTNLYTMVQWKYKDIVGGQLVIFFFYFLVGWGHPIMLTDSDDCTKAVSINVRFTILSSSAPKFWYFWYLWKLRNALQETKHLILCDLSWTHKEGIDSALQCFFSLCVISFKNLHLPFKHYISVLLKNFNYGSDPWHYESYKPVIKK